ncbi:CHRD domain-containing protein [Povalibacter sp.]|uniref:CHRD domain-containing protein n=1 Tax=Povalibacter sp. TaxID=1962978 RepID=UPI002F40F959
MRSLQRPGLAARGTIAFLWSFLLLIVAGCGGGGGYGGGNNPPPAPPPAAPTVSLGALPPGSVNRTVALEAAATASAGISRVEFVVDGTAIGSVTMAPYRIDWDTSAVADGAHSLTARVTDAAGTAVTSAAATVNVNNHPVVQVTLSPDETLPRPTSSAGGSGEFTFNLIDGSVTGGVNTTGIVATAAHIHDGFAGATGPVIVPFVQSAADPTRWDAQAGAVLTGDQVTGLLAGRLYVNVHSAAYPAGEIRAQLRCENITVVFTAMTGAEVVPAVTTSATATAATTVDAQGSTATINIISTGVDDASAAHVHKAAAGANNDTALISLTQDGAAPGRWSAQLQPITGADRTEFNDNGWYVDMHTPANAGGELRGQITPNPSAPPPPPPPPPTVTLAQLQSQIFTPVCSGCHNGNGTGLPGSMNLSSAVATFNALVGVASSEQPAVLRVAANDAANSYVIRKLEGTPGINGSRMPLGGPFLDQATIDQVKAWINAGAANN